MTSAELGSNSCATGARTSADMLLSGLKTASASGNDAINGVAGKSRTVFLSRCGGTYALTTK